MRLFSIKSPAVAFCILAFIAGGAVARDESEAVCTAAQHFAVDTAKRMQSGSSASEEFDAYGGVDAIPKGMLNIINHVYSYRVNHNITPARIGSLALAKCENGAFGGLAYSDLPEQYDPASKKDEESNSEAAAPSAVVQPQSPQQAVSTTTRVSQAAASSSSCEQYQQRIEELDSRMRAGYSSETGDSMREERRKYRELANKHCK